jgi:hypothetical protein
MKTITIRLPDVEAAMLAEVLKVRKELKNLDRFLLEQIKREYDKILR